MTDQFLGPLKLERGAHDRGTGMCAMESAESLGIAEAARRCFDAAEGVGLGTGEPTA